MITRIIFTRLPKENGGAVQKNPRIKYITNPIIKSAKTTKNIR
jgi:hypothetical protein